MAESAKRVRVTRQSVPVEIVLVRSGDETTYRLNLSEDHPNRELVFEKFGVGTVGELATELSLDRETQVRLGVLAHARDGKEFWTERELLATVEGIDTELANYLIDQFGDIPSLCEDRRRAGSAFLGNLRLNLETEGAEWVEAVSELIEEVGANENLEYRLKNAPIGNIWVEPSGEVA